MLPGRHFFTMPDTELRGRQKVIDKSANEAQYTDMNSKEHSSWSKGDKGGVALLLLLYVLQGIPLGISASIPMLLAAKKVDYQQQAKFSFVFWPFSVKLLWAPIVDSIYNATFGRRKSWLMPSQYGIAIIMYILSYKLDDLLYIPEPDIFSLTACFFLLNFGAATQDIAVDGWALTMLSKKSVGLASTCNSVGQTAGYFLGYVIFLALESEEFSNKYLRAVAAEGGLVTLASFLRFWSVVFLVVTTLVMLLKTEKPEEEECTSMMDTYKQLWKVIRLPSVTQYAIILLTSKIGFAPESIVGLKLVELGVKRESLALLAVPLTPIQICLPMIISKYTSGPKPMDIFLKAMSYRLVMVAVFALMVYFTPMFAVDGEYPFSYFGVMIIIYSLHQITLYCMFVSVMAFNAKISDPRIGGTYMTLLNTVANLGGNWPATVAMWFADKMKVSYCKDALWNSHSCYNNATIQECVNAGGSCEHATLDGYFIITAISLTIGVMWIFWKSATLKRLQFLSPQSWRTR